MRKFLVCNLALAALMLIGCGGDDDPADPNGGGGGTATAVDVASGNNQRIIVGGQLFAPLRVEVTDAQDQGVSGVTVDWEVTQGSGTLSAASSTTDANGEATITFTAGSTAETNTISASVDGVTGAATFTAIAVTPTAIAVVSGSNNQEVRTGVTIANPLEARVTAGDGGVVPGAAVEWEVTAGMGALAATTSTAGANGNASVGLTAGTAVGAIEVTASLPGGAASTTFDVQVSAPITVDVAMEFPAFIPADIPIMLGDTVRWVNNDAGLQHTATSTQVPAGGTPFDSGLLDENDEYELVLDARGDWAYDCTIHPEMTGVITVE